MNIASITLSVLAILAFLAGGYFNYDNRTRYLALVQTEQVTEGRLNETIADLGEQTARRDLEVSTKETLDGEINQLDAQVSLLNTEKSEAEAANAAVQARVDAIDQEIKTVQAQVRSIGDLGDLARQVKAKREALERMALEHAALTQELANGRARLENFNDQISHLSDLQRAQQAGEILGGLTTTVWVSFPEDGYVILHGGTDRGVVPGAKFNLERGGSLIASGQVSAVHPGHSVLRLDPATVTESAASGDRAVSIQTAASQSSPPTLGGGSAASDAPAAADAPTGDAAGSGSGGPFGGFDADPEAAADSSEEVSTSTNPFGGDGSADEAPAEGAAAAAPTDGSGTASDSAGASPFN